MEYSKKIQVFVIIMVGLFLAFNAHAATGIDVSVKTILATNQSEKVDAKCKTLIKDLQSVFRYSSYQCLSECKMNLDLGSTGKTALPGNRMMHITPIEKMDNRIKLRLEIYKENKRIFQTVIQLLNGSSLIVGGPQHQNGVLLFNISGSF